MILINPRSYKFGVFEKYVPLSVPIGIGHLAGALLSSNKKVLVLDEHISLLTEDLIKSLVSDLTPPYIFGISTLTACVKRANELANLLKTLYPESKIIFGGIHPTVLPEEILFNKNVDIVVRGEGENTLNLLYDAIKNNKDYSGIKGISFRVGEHIQNNPGADLPDLSSLPAFPYYLFDQKSGKYNFGFIASSRGCPYECIFCSQRSISGRRFRYVPVGVVEEDLDLLINNYKQSHINFLDDNFTADKKRIIELCEMMIRNKYYEKATFDCQTRADSVDDNILTILKRAGFRLINFGMETASERLMVLLNKKETVQDNINAVRMAKKHGFGVSATFIFGLPTETRKDRLDAYKLAKDLDLDYVRFNNATPYPGTKLFEIAKEEGRLFIKDDWTGLNACGSLVRDSDVENRLPYVPLSTDEKTLKKDIVRCNLFFSLRPKKVFSLIYKRVGPAGWFYLPKWWFLKPKEVFSFLRLGWRLVFTLIKNL